MKKILFLSAVALTVFACGNSTTPKHEEVVPVDSVQANDTITQAAYYGAKITPDSAISMSDLKTEMGTKTELATKVMGEVEAVCQKKGCWMNIKGENGEVMRVTFKDYKFFMPMDCSGKTAIVKGVAKIDITSIADLKEFAKDDKQTKEQIAAIKEPKKELVFEASGVILK